MSFYQNEEDRLNYYTQHRSIALTKLLGTGQDGIVYMTDVPSVVKALTFEQLFQREYAAYVRLRENNIQRVGIFNVPTMIDADASLQIVEMTFVAAPYVLDFAGAYLDTPPSYYWDEEMIAARNACREEYGDEWPDVAMLIDVLRKEHGIFLTDIKPRNIRVSQ